MNRTTSHIDLEAYMNYTHEEIKHVIYIVLHNKQKLHNATDNIVFYYGTSLVGVFGCDLRGISTIKYQRRTLK